MRTLFLPVFGFTVSILPGSQALAAAEKVRSYFDLSCSRVQAFAESVARSGSAVGLETRWYVLDQQGRRVIEEHLEQTFKDLSADCDTVTGKISLRSTYKFAKASKTLATGEDKESNFEMPVTKKFALNSDGVLVWEAQGEHPFEYLIPTGTGYIINSVVFDPSGNSCKTSDVEGKTNIPVGCRVQQEMAFIVEGGAPSVRLDLDLALEGSAA